MTFTQTLTKVVVVDQDQTMTDILENVLETQCFSIYTVDSNIRSVKAVDSIDPEVIVIDIVSQNEDGLSLCTAIRSHTNVPILALSSVCKPGFIEQMLNAGADECLIKPVSINLLVAHLKTLARRSREEKRAGNRLGRDKTYRDPCHYLS